MALVQKKLFVVAVFILSLIWVAALDRPDGRYHLWVLGTKDDLSLVVESKSGQIGVVNPKATPEFLEILGRRLPFYERRIDLLVLVDASPKSVSVLNDLTKRYQINQIWLPKSHQYISKDSEVVYLDGFETRVWEGLLWKTWQVPESDLLLSLSNGDLSLVFAKGSQEEVWLAYPGEPETTILVGPAVGRSGWKGSSLLELFKPELLILNKEVTSLVSMVAGEQEIVWEGSTWYIGGNP